MALSQIAISGNISWQLLRAVTGFVDVTQGPDALAFASNNLDVATWNELFAAQYTMLAAGTQVVDLRTFTDLPGNAVTATKAMAIMILVTGATTGVLNVKPDATDGLVWPFENVGFGVNIPGGGMILFSEGATSTGKTINATNKEFLLTNTGAVTLTVTVAALVSTL